MYGEKGFTLMEIVIGLAVLAILAGAITPFLFQKVEAERVAATREEMKVFYKAMMGDPELGTYGYVGDVGLLPDSLEHLIRKPSGVSSFATYTNGVGYGWRGPYITTRYNDFLDAWGTSYRYAKPPDSAGQIRSAGRDKTFDNEDDIVFPLHTVVTQGTLLVTTFVNGVPNPKDVWVTLYSVVNGQQDSVGAQSTNDVGFGGFVFTVPQGIQMVKVTQISYVKTTGGQTIPTPVVKRVNVAVPARKQVSLEAYLKNSEPVVP